MKKRILAFAAALALGGCGARTSLGLDEKERELQAVPGVFTADCPDATGPEMFVISLDRELLRVIPESGVFLSIGFLDCPGFSEGSPHSLAVDRAGNAYVLFELFPPDGPSQSAIFRVDTRDASCTATSYVPQQGFQPGDITFATIEKGPEERLFVSGRLGSSNTATLASLDTSSFQLEVVGPIADDGFPAVAGTGDGRLFSLIALADSAGSDFAPLDKSTAKIQSRRHLDVDSFNSAFAFAYWRGDFFIFSPFGLGTMVNRFRPSDGSVVEIAQSAARISGAGASTCSPVLE